MKVGLQFHSFTWPGGTGTIGPKLARSVCAADDAGFDSLWVMDHFWQVGGPDAELEPMLEGLTTLGFMAAHSRRARLGLMVGGVHHRAPGLWAKAVTTLDVLSGGRAWLGIGAGWNRAESDGLGFGFPSIGDRFGMLEETLHIVRRMWEGERGSEATFEGRHYRANRLLNVPQSISRPRVPILIGGGGERRTLRLVAQYADATNIIAGPDELRAKYAILAEHCAAVGRSFSEIERTTFQPIGLGGPSGFAPKTESADEIVDRLGRLAEAGAQHVIVGFGRTGDPDLVELLASRILPQLRAIEAAAPSQILAAA